MLLALALGVLVDLKSQVWMLCVLVFFFGHGDGL